MISEAARFARLRRTFSREPNAAPEDYLGEEVTEAVITVCAVVGFGVVVLAVLWALGRVLVAIGGAL